MNMRKASPNSGSVIGTLRWRLCSVVVVCVCALSVYLYSSGGEQGVRVPSGGEWPGEAGSKKQTWYREGYPTWTGFGYQLLADRDGVVETVRGIVANRYSGPKIDEAGLTESLAGFLHAAGAGTPDEYLGRIVDSRTLRSDVYSDSFVHTWYRVVREEALPSGLNTYEVLKRMWPGPAGSPGRPVAMSTGGALQVAWSKPVPKDGYDRRKRLSALVFPQFSMWKQDKTLVWRAPFVEGFPRLTAPSVSLENVAASVSRVLLCHVKCVLKSAEGTYIPTELLLYFESTANVWHVEWFSNYYPEHVCWAY